MEAARALGMDLTLALSAFAVPNLDNNQIIGAIYNQDRTRYEAMLSQREGIADAARKVAADNGVPLIDGYAYLEGNPELFYDELHLNRAGQDRFARFLASQISKT